MRRQSFTIKIFSCFCIVILLSVLVPCGYFLYSIRQESIAFTRNEALRETIFIENYIAEELTAEGRMEVNEFSEVMKKFFSGNSHRVTLIDKDGEVLYDSLAGDAVAFKNHKDHAEIAQAFAEGTGSSVRHSLSLEQPFVYIARKVDIPGSDIAIIRVASSLQLVEEHAASRSKALMAGALIAVIFALGVAAFMSVKFRRSLQLMITSVENLAVPGSRSGRISLRTLPGDEFAPLAEAVNSMAQRMDTQVSHILAQKAQIDAVLESITEGVLVIDREGGIRSANTALARFFPRVRHAEGLRVRDVIPSQELMNGIEMLKFEETKNPLQFEMDTAAGRKLQVQLCPIVGEMKFLLAVAVFHDITEMSALMDMRRDFVANVSHELRTPLTAIMGYAESLKRFVAEPRGQHFLEVIDRNSQYMATMVKDLLQLSSIEHGAAPMNIGPLSSSTLIRCGMDLCRGSGDGKNLRFCEKLEQGDIFVKGDLEFLTRVMRNLLENACRYAPEGTDITLSATLGKGQGEAVFCVHDEGPGIPPELRARVFERFFRVEKHRGGQLSTGLGLAICKHIVERHGGRIYVEDTAGCSICFTIPLA